MPFLEANSCLHDAGSPVYQFDCSGDISNGIAASKPKCLYGLMKPKTKDASKLHSGHNSQCNREETFLNITDMLPHIRNIITMHVTQIKSQ